MRKFHILALAATLSLSASALANDHAPAPQRDAKAVLSNLMAGNARFTSGDTKHPHSSPERVKELAQAQHPEAIVICCSDSREVPELIFDQGMGDLFVIRLAGNIIDDAVLASVEYAAAHLGSPLVVVLGHERCGAVAATVKGGKPEGHIGCLCKAIQPALDSAKKQDGDLAENTMRENVRNGVNQIKSSHEVLGKLVKDNKLTVVGARYDLDTGKVTLIED